MPMMKTNRTPAQQLLQVVSMMGMLLLENGGEVYRAEDTMKRIASSKEGITEVDVLATPGWLFVSFRANEETLTNMKRVKSPMIHLARVAKLNDLSRRITAGDLSLHEAEVSLLAIRENKDRHPLWPIIGGVIGVFFYTLLIGAGRKDALCSGIAALAMLLCMRWLERFHITFFVSTFVGAVVSTTFAIGFLQLGIVSDFNSVVVGSIMLLFPGISITNSMRDSLSGDFISGLTHAMTAVAIAFGIALGVGTMLLFYREFIA